MKFNFADSLAISKSWMNRALILQSYCSGLKILGQSESDDVFYLKQALDNFLNNQNEFYVGLGGTTFRFLALRVSRKSGLYRIKADKKLFERPQNEIINILSQVGVQSEFNADRTEFIIHSQGWVSQKEQLVLHVDSKDSSQFLSSVLLNSIDLPFDLVIQTDDQITSIDYLKYTVSLMKTCGVSIQSPKDGYYKVFKKSLIRSQELIGEVDVSSFFSLACAAVLAGHACLKNWNAYTLQPDKAFLKIFNTMGIQYKIEGSQFEIKKHDVFYSARVNLENCPDLFPSLAVVCAFATGESELYGARQLVHKESNRIEKTYELLSACEIKCEMRTDGIKIWGDPDYLYKKKNLILFNPEHDHRMAFAAALLILKGFPIQIEQPEVITKSYPQFYQHIGLNIPIEKKST